jgi:hypothetical protein
MTFTTPCFVRVENPEKRKELIEWLELIGYKLEYLRNDGVIVLTSENRVYVYGEAVHEIIKSDYDAIDCGKNIELFKALAAMNYENYREQWFVEEGKMFKCTSDKINNYPYNWPNTRKATVEEIVEYFKNKER